MCNTKNVFQEKLSKNVLPMLSSHINKSTGFLTRSFLLHWIYQCTNTGSLPKTTRLNKTKWDVSFPVWIFISNFSGCKSECSISYYPLRMSLAGHISSAGSLRLMNRDLFCFVVRTGTITVRAGYQNTRTSTVWVIFLQFTALCNSVQTVNGLLLMTDRHQQDDIRAKWAAVFPLKVELKYSRTTVRSDLLLPVVSVGCKFSTVHTVRKWCSSDVEMFHFQDHLDAWIRVVDCILQLHLDLLMLL